MRTVIEYSKCIYPSGCFYAFWQYLTFLNTIDQNVWHTFLVFTVCIKYQLVQAWWDDISILVSYQQLSSKNVLYNSIYTYWKCNTVCPNMDWLKSSKTMMWPFQSCWNGIRNIYLFFCYQKLEENFSCYITFFWFIGYKLLEYTSLMKDWNSNIKATAELVYFPVNPSRT